MNTYKLYKWEKGLNSVALIKLIMEIKSQSLLASKKEVEMFLLGDPIFFETDELRQKEIIQSLNTLGVSVSKTAK